MFKKIQMVSKNKEAFSFFGIDLYSLNLGVLPYDFQTGEGCLWHLSNTVERRLKRE